MKIPPSTPVYHTPISPSPPPIHTRYNQQSQINHGNLITSQQAAKPPTTGINFQGSHTLQQLHMRQGRVRERAVTTKVAKWTMMMVASPASYEDGKYPSETGKSTPDRTSTRSAKSESPSSTTPKTRNGTCADTASSVAQTAAAGSICKIPPYCRCELKRQVRRHEEEWQKNQRSPP